MDSPWHIPQRVAGAAQHGVATFTLSQLDDQAEEQQQQRQQRQRGIGHAPASPRKLLSAASPPEAALRYLPLTAGLTQVVPKQTSGGFFFFFM